MRVDVETLWQATRFYHQAFSATYYDSPHFLKLFGITTQQWSKYKQTKKLKVSPEAAAKLKHASLLMNPHGTTLLKVLEARKSR